MKSRCLLFPCLLVTLSLSASVEADTGTVGQIRTLTGRTYRDCRILKTEPDGVSFVHANGAAKVLFADLNDDMRATLGFDARKAAAYEKDLAAKRAKEREKAVERRKELLKAQAEALQNRLQALRVLESQYLAGAGYASTLQGGVLSYPVPVPAVGLLAPYTYSPYGPLSQIQGPYLGGSGYYNAGLSGVYSPYAGPYGCAPFRHGSVTVAGFQPSGPYSISSIQNSHFRGFRGPVPFVGHGGIGGHAQAAACGVRGSVTVAAPAR